MRQKVRIFARTTNVMFKKKVFETTAFSEQKQKLKQRCRYALTCVKYENLNLMNYSKKFGVFCYVLFKKIYKAQNYRKKIDDLKSNY